MPHPDAVGAHPAHVPAADAETRAAESSLGDILSEVSRDVSTLMRQELELAKAELRESGTKAGKAAGFLGGAGVAGHLVLTFLSLALMFAIGELIGLGWAALVVAVLWAVIAAVLAAKGRKEMQQVRGLPATAETIKDIPPTLKPGEQTP
jgi:hypothetical protein